MMKENFSYLSKDGETMIHAARWIPAEGKYRAILQITHGMIEFIERYADFAEYLTRNGFMVVGNDHLGHGDSVRSREDWGYFTAENAAEILVGDMHTLREITQRENPELPYFMLGHSMGSFLLRRYLAVYGGASDGTPGGAFKGASEKEPDGASEKESDGTSEKVSDSAAEGAFDGAERAGGRLSGAIIMGTGYTDPRESAVGIRIAQAFAGIYGWKHRSRLVTFLVFHKNLRYDTTGRNPEKNWLSKDPGSVKRYYSDPRCTYTFTLNGYRTLFETVAFVCRQEKTDLIPKGLPILIVSGSDDPVGERGAGVRRVASMMKKAGIGDLKMKLYKGYRHEILNEVGKERVYSDILHWMKKRM